MNDLKGITLSFICTGVMAEAMIKALSDQGLREGLAHRPLPCRLDSLSEVQIPGRVRRNDLHP